MTTNRNGATRVLVAGATGYLGKFVVEAFESRGYWVRALARSEDRLRQPGPFTAPAIGVDDVENVFVGEWTKPETLTGLMDGIDIVFSCVGISRQRDGLTFEQVDHQCNSTLIELAKAGEVRLFGERRPSTSSPAPRRSGTAPSTAATWPVSASTSPREMRPTSRWVARTS